MELFIQIRDGQPYEHPIFKDNLLEAFPGINLHDLPSSFARFEKSEPPILGPYDICHGVEYIWAGDVVKESYVVTRLSEEEKLAKQNDVKEAWAMNPNWASWTFNEDLCAFEPPVPLPNDGKHYMWEEALGEWKEVDSI